MGRKARIRGRRNIHSIVETQDALIRADVALIRDWIRGMLLGSAGLPLAASVPLARDAITGPFTLAIVVASFLLLSFTKLESAWLMLGAAIGLAAKLLP